MYTYIYKVERALRARIGPWALVGPPLGPPRGPGPWALPWALVGPCGISGPPGGLPGIGPCRGAYRHVKTHISNV